MMSEQNLRVQVVDDNIVVTLPGYSYSVAYYKPDRSPGLLVKYSVTKNDLRLSMTDAQFLAKAWKLANDKARAPGLDIFLIFLQWCNDISSIWGRSIQPRRARDGDSFK